MIEGFEAVDLPENMQAEPGHKASADNRENATGEGVLLPSPAEEEVEGLIRDHSWKGTARSHWSRRSRRGNRARWCRSART